MAKYNKENHEAAAAVATAPEAPTEETPEVETPEATPEAAPAEEAPAPAATAEVSNVELAAQIANAPEGAVQTTTVKLPPGASELKGDRKRIAHKLGGLAALISELGPEIMKMLNTEVKTMTPKERDYWFDMIQKGDVIANIALDGVEVICGKEPKLRRD